jgi:hypothetical protein
MDYAWDVTEERKQNVDPELLANANLQEYPQGREEYRDNDAEQIHREPLSVANSLYLIRCQNLLVAGSESIL